MFQYSDKIKIQRNFNFDRENGLKMYDVKITTLISYCCCSYFNNIIIIV